MPSAPPIGTNPSPQVQIQGTSVIGTQQGFVKVQPFIQSTLSKENSKVTGLSPFKGAQTFETSEGSAEVEKIAILILKLRNYEDREEAFEDLNKRREIFPNLAKYL